MRSSTGLSSSLLKLNYVAVILAATVLAQHSCILEHACVVGAQESFGPEVNQKLLGLGVGPDSAGLKAYFKSYLPESSSSRRVARLINELGSDSFSVRTTATTELAKINLTDLPLVQEATKSEDLEVSLRARQVIEMFNKGTHLKRLSQVLTLIEENRIQGFVPELCTTFEVVNPSNILKRQFEKTITQSMAAGDVDELRRRLNDRSLRHRDTFVRVLVDFEPGKNLDLLAKLANADPDDTVVLAAATGLAKLPDRRCLGPLVRLLDNDSIRIRSRANLVLRMVTGKRFGFVAIADKEIRNQAVLKWTRWFDESAEDATLFKNSLPKKNYVNRLIVGSYSQRRVFETDLNGKVLRTFTSVGAPMGVCGAEDGSVLICDYTGKRVVVYGADDKIIFNKQFASGPLGAEILDNGNFLIGVSSTKKVIEFDRNGKTVWQADLPSRVNVVHRTPENTTLVSMLGAGKVVELDESGKTIFELEVHKPNGVRRLENGNTLVCLYDKGEVHEYDPDKIIVWKASSLTKPARAQRLPDGNTIIYHRKGVVIYDAGGKLLRKIPIKELRSGDVGTVHFF